VTIEPRLVRQTAASVRARYDALVSEGVIERDPAQEKLVARLDDLAQRIGERRLARKASPLGWLFGKRNEKAEPLKGLYIWGSVGRGKTMLMDLFFEVAPPERKRRAHFHAFMADVHERIFAHRQKVKDGREKDGDPIPHVADALAAEAWLLCFDEFTVTDIADAMILGRLFTALFSRGVTVVATSNVEPSRLYENGLNRALFLPFIDLLTSRVEVIRLDSRTDFRLEKLAGSPVYHVPADAAAEAALDEAFFRLTGRHEGKPAAVHVKGRTVPVPSASDGVARFTFAELCERPLGASDYLALAERYRCIILAGIPVMDLAQRNAAKRFITLIDTLYEKHVKLIASAEAEPHALYRADQGREVFEFDRTVSRLIEMRSEAYLALPHGQGDSRASGDTTGLVET